VPCSSQLGTSRMGSYCIESLCEQPQLRLKQQSLGSRRNREVFIGRGGEQLCVFLNLTSSGLLVSETLTTTSETGEASVCSCGRQHWINHRIEGGGDDPPPINLPFSF